MTTFETTLLGVLALTTALMILPWSQQPLSLALVLIALTLAIAYLILHPMRWQMFPAHIIALSFLIVTLWDPNPNIYFKSAGYIAAFAALALSLFLTNGMPLTKLPAPTGKHKIGTISTTMAREGDSGHRQLSIKLWYPASIEPNATDNNRDTMWHDTMWSEFYRTDTFPTPLKFATGYLRKLHTSAYLSASIKTGDTPYPVIIYNHGLISITAENSLLMETLASNGYLVISVRHNTQDTEYATIQKNLPIAEKTTDKRLMDILSTNEIDRKTRASLSLEYFQNSTGMATIVKRRTQDSSFALDNLDTLVAKIPGCEHADCVDRSKIGAIGLSTGGAIATELCKTDARCIATINLDGGIFADDPLAPITKPYLMLYSAFNNGSNDFLKAITTSHFEEHVIPGAKHMNFHDAGTILPILKWFGILGPVPGSEINRQKDLYVQTFFDEILKSKK